MKEYQKIPLEVANTFSASRSSNNRLGYREMDQEDDFEDDYEDERPLTSLEALREEFKDSPYFEIELLGDVTPRSGRNILRQLRAFRKIDPKKEIVFRIESDGGTTSVEIDIIKQMKNVENPISTVTELHAYSAGAELLAAGDKGKRYAYEDAEVMIHQEQYEGMQFTGSAPDIKAGLKDFFRDNDLTNKMLAEACGKSQEELEKLTQKDLYLTAQEAKEFGIVDIVLPRKKNSKLPPPKELPIWEKGLN